MSYLWLVSRTDDWDYDEFESFVCVAPDAAYAVRMCPTYGHLTGAPVFHADASPLIRRTWTEPQNLRVERLGTADCGEPRIVAAVFNAG